MTDIGNVENIIFNPLIYGSVIFENNNFDNIINEDTVEFKIKSHFNNDVFLNNNLNINTNTKININDTTINTDELVQVKNINQIKTELTQYTNSNDIIVDEIKTELTQYTNSNDIVVDEINNNMNALNEDVNYCKEKYHRIIKLNNDFEFKTIDYDIYVIEDKIKIILPKISDKIIGKKLTFTSNLNNTSLILSNKADDIINVKNNEYKLRNYNTINFVPIDLKNWIYF